MIKISPRKSIFSSLKYRCVLVEDEPLAAEMMMEYISNRSELSLIDVVDNLDDYEEALTRDKRIDIIFLDLKIRGGEVYQLTEHKPNTVFVVVSAYPPKVSKYLPKDIGKYFITKPVSITSFNSCIDRLLNDKELAE